MKTKKRIILGVTGSVAAYKSAEITRRLLDKGFSVSVVMTKEAERFITPLTLSSLSEEKVYGGMFDEASDPAKMPHIELAKRASVLLIAPATANIIAKLACGMADDLISCIALGMKAPILIAPAMNTEMYKNKIVQSNIEFLKKHGMKFVNPIKGKLACGTTGEGHIADEETIVKAVVQAAK